MTEIWLPVEEGYEVSSNGRVRSLDRKISYKDGRVGNFRGVDLNPARGKNGYLTVTVGKFRRVLVHRLVGGAFIPNPLNLPVINHINGDKRDNRVENLEWSDYGANNGHARAAGLNNQHAENCNLTIYESRFVSAVRRVHERYGSSYTELALLFDISQAQAADIVKGRSRARG